ncbi:hypothetical protein PM082_015289 [Marasmius tenuissimus]|nr:hypothetical protein PM082_015289 [Marasmius tenuissimus]
MDAFSTLNFSALFTLSTDSEASFTIDPPIATINPKAAPSSEELPPLVDEEAQSRGAGNFCVIA